MYVKQMNFIALIKARVNLQALKEAEQGCRQTAQIDKGHRPRGASAPGWGGPQLWGLVLS